MAYTVTNFKTKKALKEAVNDYNKFQLISDKHDINNPSISCFNPGLGPDLSNFTGKVCSEGPHYPQAAYMVCRS